MRVGFVGIFFFHRLSQTFHFRLSIILARILCGSYFRPSISTRSRSSMASNAVFFFSFTAPSFATRHFSQVGFRNLNVFLFVSSSSAMTVFPFISFPSVFFAYREINLRRHSFSFLFLYLYFYQRTPIQDLKQASLNPFRPATNLLKTLDGSAKFLANQI